LVPSYCFFLFGEVQALLNVSLLILEIIKSLVVHLLHMLNVAFKCETWLLFNAVGIWRTNISDLIYSCSYSWAHHNRR